MSVAHRKHAVRAVSRRAHAASCSPRPRHTNRSSQKKEKIEARDGARNPFISFSFYYTPQQNQARVTFLQRESVLYDVTFGVPLLFETLDRSAESPSHSLQLFGFGPSVVDETQLIMGFLAQSGNTNIIYLFCTLFHMKDFSPPRSAPHPLLPFPQWTGHFGEGSGTRGGNGK